VSLKKSTGRWEARCAIGGKVTSLGQFGSEEEAARARDHMRLWSCKAAGKKKGEVEGKLNFPLSEYSDDEVTALQGLTQEEMLKKLRRSEERVANQSSKYRGVRLHKSTCHWEVQFHIGGKQTSLGYFANEEEATRAYDRMKLWSCKAGGKEKEEVELELNFPLSGYSDDEVAALQGLTQEEIIQKLRRKEERAAKSSEYTGVTLEKRTGRWRAHCKIRGKLTSLGTFGSEEEAARAYDRMRLWRCKADGNTKEEVKLNFPLSEYSDNEVTALHGLTREEMLEKLQRMAKQSRSECGAKAVERPASPGPGATAAVKRGAADVVPSVEAPAGQPPLKKSKVAAEVSTEEEEIAARGLAPLGKPPPPPPAEAENPTPPPPEYVVVMNGNPLACGICFEEFDNTDETGATARHMFWPCQHARQCGECASRVWKTPGKRRRCPWCSAKIDSGPRPLKPYV
jgi:hypothetical protein